MIRCCIATATPVEAKQRENGEWSAEGLGAAMYIEQMRLKIAQSHPFNVTFYLTTEADECLDRLKTNQSDVSSVILPVDSISTGFHVPQPMFVGQLQFISGYNITEKEEMFEDTATVLSNADLLEIEVYYWALLLLVSFFTFIVLRTAMFCVMLRHIVKMSPVRIIRRQLSRMFYYDSESFKWITFLYSLLSFILITSFLCLYKTSHIIMKKPFYPKSYQESLDHESSLAFYYDQFTICSSIFKNAPPHSIRGKLWAKLAATGRQHDYDGTVIDFHTQPQILKKGSEEMNVRHGILITPSLIIPLIKSLACGFSPEGELWIVKNIGDSIENQVIYGYALSKHFDPPRLSSMREQALFETHFLPYSTRKQFDQGEMSANLAGTSKHHQWRQKVVCEDENAFAPGPVVKAISLSYFASFFQAIAVVWLIAFFLHIFQILSY